MLNKMSLDVKVLRVHQDALIPKYAHLGDAGMDLYSVEDYLIKPGERKLIKTGLKISFPEGYEAQVRPKSGLALKHGISVINTPGTVDCHYRGELGVVLINHGQNPYEVKRKEKIAQLVFNKIEYANIESVNSLSETVRGEGGFGSTGLKY